MGARLLRAAALLLPLLAAGCVQRQNIVYPPPVERIEAVVVVPPALTPEQQRCLEGLQDAVRREPTVQGLRQWEIEARNRPGCTALRLDIQRPRAPSDPPLALDDPLRRVLVERYPPDPSQPPTPRLLAIAGDPPPDPRPRVETTFLPFEVRVEVPVCPPGQSCPPEPCPAAESCPACPDCDRTKANPPPAQPGTSPLEYAAPFAIGGGLAYALCYFQVLGVPGLMRPPAPQPGDLPGQSERPVALAAATPDPLTDPRVRIRSSQLTDPGG